MKYENKVALAIVEALGINPNREDFDEIKEHLNNEDFMCSIDGMEYRCINSTAIDEIQREELGSDLYMLGCFNVWFLAGVLGIDSDVIQAMQDAQAYEAIGKLIISLDKLWELQEEYVRADGYGHHFGHHDGNMEETGYVENEEFYYIFRVQ